MKRVLLLLALLLAALLLLTLHRHYPTAQPVDAVQESLERAYGHDWRLPA